MKSVFHGFGIIDLATLIVCVPMIAANLLAVLAIIFSWIYMPVIAALTLTVLSAVVIISSALFIWK